MSEGQTDGRPEDVFPLNVASSLNNNTGIPSIQGDASTRGPRARHSAVWAGLQTRFAAAIRPESIAALAAAWGISVDSLERLGIGFDAESAAYTFPMRGTGGEILGVRKRSWKELGRKYAVKDSTQGLFVPKGVTAGNVEAICEGESDTAAGLTLGFSTVGRPSATTGSELIVQFIEPSAVPCPCVVADNDAAGRDGAEKLADSLLAARIPCRVLVVPDPYGDLREWLTKGPLTAEQLSEAINTQDIRWPDSFPPGFVMVPNALLRCGAVAKVGIEPCMLACLVQSFHGKSGKMFPERQELARLLGVHVGTVDRWKRQAEDAGLIRWQRGGTGRANLYTVNLGPRMDGKKSCKTGK